MKHKNRSTNSEALNPDGQNYYIKNILTCNTLTTIDEEKSRSEGHFMFTLLICIFDVFCGNYGTDTTCKNENYRYVCQLEYLVSLLKDA